MGNLKKTDKLNYIFELLCEFDEYCKRHDIRIFLDWGTLLGAVRHRDFIPWDYDVDISLSWEDYLKLLKAWEKDPLPNRALVNWDIIPEATSFWLRFVDTTTTELRRSNSWGILPSGMSIDVFIMIPIKDDPKIMQEVSSSYLVYHELMNRLFVNKRTRDEATVKLLKESLERIEAGEDRKAITDELRAKALSCVNDPDFTHYYSTTAGFRVPEYCRREFVDELTEIPLRGVNFFAPKKYVEYLRSRYYGPSWRNFPKGTPKEYKYIESLKVPYQVYENHYLRVLNCAEVMEDFAKAKDYGLEDILIRRQISTPMYYLAYERLAWHLEKYGDPVNYTLDTMPDDLKSLLYEIVQLQLSDKVKYWHIWFGLDDAWLNLIFDMLLQSDEFNNMQKLLDFRLSGSAQPLSSELQDKAQSLAEILELFDALDYRDVEYVRKALAQLEAKDFDSKAIAYEARLFLARSEVDKTKEYRVLENLAKEYLQIFPDSLELLSYYAYARACQGDVETALREYEKIEQSSDNGMLLLAIKDDKEGLKQ